MGIKYNMILTKEILENDYKNLGTIAKIAQKYNIDPQTISKYMNIYNIHYNKYIQCKYTFDNIFEQDTEESFYVAGFFAADGTVNKRKKYNTYTTKLCLGKKDLEHLDMIKNILKSTHPIIYNKSTNSCQFTIVSQKLFNSLKRFNIVPNKTFTYEFPQHLINHPLIHHFMRGYVDGDGSFSYLSLMKGRKIRQLQMHLRGTEKFLTTFVSILEKHTKLHSNNRIKKYDSTYSINYAGNNNVSTIVKFLYKNSTIFLKRKYNLIKHLIDKN